jgi:hypothetical protein
VTYTPHNPDFLSGVSDAYTRGIWRECLRLWKEELPKILAAEGAPKPRPRDDMVRNPRHVLWTEDEEDFLRKHYALKGAIWCQKILTHRTYRAVQKRGQDLGLARKRQK